ncbi:hypothetical protein B0A55_00349 [Friedmanniomyces simplex]|uniref:MARVEL domain-containing protein n=1 Tax=Friedmanniomyces simplex TaxID=329884 RepID=A0A4V5NL70_9PEZI|nr:hypothetical protein B0A55_00349 [Friedmanniomyces simplex]
MGLFKGGALRLSQTALYGLIFCCAGIILGIYSYFLSVLADRHQPISQQSKAVEGISGAAVVYLIFAVLLTCCFGGISILAFLAIALDICFCGAMIAIAVMTRHGASSCKGFVRTPLGNGQSGSGTGGFGLNTAAFAVSLIAAFLFLCTAAMQILLVRNHKKEKRYGPSPSNGYTSGSGKKRGLFARKSKAAPADTTTDTELGTTTAATGAGALAANHHDMRPSHETGYTGSTVAAPGNVDPYEKIDPQHHGGHAPHGTHGGYYTQPQGTGVNPYGYENSATQPTYQTGTATNY